MDWITPAFSLVSAIIGALIGGSMALIASSKATKIAHKNNLDLQERNRRSTVNSLIQALYDEIHTIWSAYKSKIGSDIDKLKSGESILLYYPITQEYFTIYNGNALLMSPSGTLMLLEVTNAWQAVRSCRQ